MRQASSLFTDLVSRIENNESEYIYYDIISSMTAKELDIFLSVAVFGNTDLKNYNKKLKDNKEEYFERLCQEWYKMSNIKSPLWLILSIKEKILMCTLQKHPIEFKLMVLMIWRELNFSSKNLK